MGLDVEEQADDREVPQALLDAPLFVWWSVVVELNASGSAEPGDVEQAVAGLADEAAGAPDGALWATLLASFAATYDGWQSRNRDLDGASDLGMVFDLFIPRLEGALQFVDGDAVTAFVDRLGTLSAGLWERYGGTAAKFESSGAQDRLDALPRRVTVPAVRVPPPVSEPEHDQAASEPTPIEPAEATPEETGEPAETGTPAAPAEAAAEPEEADPPVRDAVTMVGGDSPANEQVWAQQRAYFLPLQQAVEGAVHARRQSEGAPELHTDDQLLADGAKALSVELLPERSGRQVVFRVEERWTEEAAALIRVEAWVLFPVVGLREAFVLDEIERWTKAINKLRGARPDPHENGRAVLQPAPPGLQGGYNEAPPVELVRLSAGQHQILGFRRPYLPWPCLAVHPVAKPTLGRALDFWGADFPMDSDALDADQSQTKVLWFRAGPDEFCVLPTRWYRAPVAPDRVAEPDEPHEGPSGGLVGGMLAWTKAIFIDSAEAAPEEEGPGDDLAHLKVLYPDLAGGVVPGYAIAATHLKLAVDFGTSASAAAFVGAGGLLPQMIHLNPRRPDRPFISSDVLYRSVIPEHRSFFGVEEGQFALVLEPRGPKPAWCEDAEGYSGSTSLKRLLAESAQRGEPLDGYLDLVTSVFEELLRLALCPQWSRTLSAHAFVQAPTGATDAELNTARDTALADLRAQVGAQPPLPLNKCVAKFSVAVSVPDSASVQLVRFLQSAVREAVRRVLDLCVAEEEIHLEPGDNLPRDLATFMDRRVNIRIVREAEATAWALPEGIDQEENPAILVLDVGAGTTDAALVQNLDYPRVLAAAGLPIGGDDADLLLLRLASEGTFATDQAQRSTAPNLFVAGQPVQGLMQLGGLEAPFRARFREDIRGLKESWSRDVSHDRTPESDPGYLKLLALTKAIVKALLGRAASGLVPAPTAVVLGGRGSKLPGILEGVTDLLRDEGLSATVFEYGDEGIAKTAVVRGAARWLAAGGGGPPADLGHGLEVRGTEPVELSGEGQPPCVLHRSGAGCQAMLRHGAVDLSWFHSSLRRDLVTEDAAHLTLTHLCGWVVGLGGEAAELMVNHALGRAWLLNSVPGRPGIWRLSPPRAMGGLARHLSPVHGLASDWFWR